MAVTQYIGARYVPLFADPVEWTNTRTYEPLTIVLHEGNSFTSRQFVPKGIDITNGDFWVETGNYNAQVELYRQDVARYNNRIGVLEGDLPIGEFSEDRTVKGYIDETAQGLQGNIDALAEIVPSTEFTSEDTVKDYVDAASLLLQGQIDNLDAIIPSSSFASETSIGSAV